MLKQLWDKASEDEKKTIYGDILKLPWSNAHIKKTKDKTPENVAGVMGNILETPQKARERYEKDLEKFEDDPKELSIFKHDPSEGDLSKEKILDEFEEKHDKWYESAKENHKPIIGGISGHTLGYLNLYEEALSNAEQEKDPEMKHYPSMEILRAIMLGALIGDKRHHSYDEVMSASHKMPTHDDQGTLEYKHPDSYLDVLDSETSEIQSAANAARDDTKQSVDKPESNTILHMLMNRVYDQEKEQLNQLKQHIKTYMDKGFHTEASKEIIEDVNEMSAPVIKKNQKQKLDDSRLKIFEPKEEKKPEETNRKPTREISEKIKKLMNHFEY